VLKPQISNKRADIFDTLLPHLFVDRLDFASEEILYRKIAIDLWLKIHDKLKC